MTDIFSLSLHRELQSSIQRQLNWPDNLKLRLRNHPIRAQFCEVPAFWHPKALDLFSQITFGYSKGAHQDHSYPIDSNTVRCILNDLVKTSNT